VYADLRFVEHTLDELIPLAGIASIDAVIPSHYHDDHLAGVPFLRERHGTQAWIHASFADIVRRPDDWKLPCLWGTPFEPDRVLEDGERVAFGPWGFDVFHMPGHTWYALGLVGEVDGTRIAFTGDNLLAGSITPLRAAAPIYRNRMRLDSIRVGVQRLIEHEPELLLSGHTGAIPVTRPVLDDFIAWARRLELAFGRLVAVPELVDEALDPDLVWMRPYRSVARPGVELALTIGVTNHAPGAAAAELVVEGPDGWAVAPARARLEIPGGGVTAEVGVVVAVSASARPGERVILTADLTLRGRRYGQRGECIVDVEDA
jgi:glyoxylase-like metal-dependent hydrolase (beta-lactamase superfamily II)